MKLSERVLLLVNRRTDRLFMLKPVNGGQGKGLKMFKKSFNDMKVQVCGVRGCTTQGN